MTKIMIAVCLLGSLCAAPAHALDPPAAKSLMDSAIASSAKQHKPVFVMFAQSKCEWCKRFDALVNRPEFKKQFEANYIVLHLDVLEGGDAIKRFENAGGRDYLAKYGGAKDVPFCAWVDAKGRMLANSNALPGGVNFGYPAQPAQIDAFVGQIKKTAPHWPASDLRALRDYLVANPPK